MSPNSNVPSADEKKPKKSVDLPDEIWSKIGKLVIDAHPPLSTGTIENQYWSIQDGSPFGVEQAYQPAITRVCRYLRKELLPYYYQQMEPREDIRIYAIDEETGVAKMVKTKIVGKWLRAIGKENRKHVGPILVTCSVDERVYLEELEGLDTEDLEKARDFVREMVEFNWQIGVKVEQEYIERPMWWGFTYPGHLLITWKIMTRH